MEENKIIIKNLCFLAVSIVVTYISFFVIGPMAEFSEGKGAPITSDARPRVFTVSVLFLVVYLICFLKMVKKLRYFNFLNYPFIVLNLVSLLILIFVSIVKFGVFIILFFGIPLILLPFLLIALIVIGMFLDIKSWEAYIKAKK